MPEKLGNGGNSLEEYSSETGQYISDGEPNKYYDNPKEKSLSRWQQVKKQELEEEKASEIGGVDVTNKNSSKKLKERALEEFGRTYDFYKAFWLTEDGIMLNGDEGGGYRSLDHRSVARIYEDEDFDTQTSYMLDFKRKGNIRISPESNSIDITAKPTEKQMQQIANWVRRGYITAIEIDKDKSDFSSDSEYLDDIMTVGQALRFINDNFKMED